MTSRHADSAGGNRPGLSPSRGLAEWLLVIAGLAVFTTILTYPLAFQLGTMGYKPNQVGDAQYSIWNVGWVAHALLTHPFRVLDANIFYPYSQTLIYSEANLVAGGLAVPVYAISGNVFAAHNSVVLLSFVLSGAGMYYLVRYLTGDRRAAVISAICFAFCPYMFGHLLHIQLLMTAGIPFSLLAFHRLADRPSPLRGAVLGVAMGLQGLACAYYAVFVAMLIGYAVIFTATTTPSARSRRYWMAVGMAAAVSAAIVMPLFSLYLNLQRDTGFGRELAESGNFSASWASYLTSSSLVSSWIYRTLLERFSPPAFTDQLFPGVLTAVFGVGGAIIGWRAGGRLAQLAGLYGSIAALAFWVSLGPRGGLYAAIYSLPGFSFLRAPSRFGLVVTFALVVLAGITAASVLRRASMPQLTAAALMFAVAAEQFTPIPLTPIDPVRPAYYALAGMPDGALLEMPPRSHKYAFTRTQYMINSTAHWKPIVNAYSDFVPDSLYNSLDTLAAFPSQESFDILKRDRVRYVAFDLREYNREPALRAALDASLARFAPSLHELFRDDQTVLYEIVSFP